MCQNRLTCIKNVRHLLVTVREAWWSPFPLYFPVVGLNVYVRATLKLGFFRKKAFTKQVRN